MPSFLQSLGFAQRQDASSSCHHAPITASRSSPEPHNDNACEVAAPVTLPSRWFSFMSSSSPSSSSSSQSPASSLSFNDSMKEAKSMAIRAVQLDNGADFDSAAIAYAKTSSCLMKLMNEHKQSLNDATLASMINMFKQYSKRALELQSRSKSEPLPVVAAQGLAIISQAIKVDREHSPSHNRADVALSLYTNGIGNLLQSLPQINSPSLKRRLKLRIDKYLSRAEYFRSIVQQSSSSTADNTMSSNAASTPPLQSANPDEMLNEYDDDDDDEFDVHMSSRAPLCVVCIERDVNCVFFPCGHSTCCMECGNDILSAEQAACVICRKPIDEAKHIFISGSGI